ncbi:hypothetical protein SKAU_G00318910 [Synaphobranchus kaupii]|uniref:Uncharacterized protein n=1 Tax=Synaphobranchus kaupii TaxID=118154 RepID=A0A9Q1IM08_SYNKA|nr:hypothetical protein SKAU_G00318910 [Synaphobranchus kaupii]
MRTSAKSVHTNSDVAWARSGTGSEESRSRMISCFPLYRPRRLEICFLVHLAAVLPPPRGPQAWRSIAYAFGELPPQSFRARWPG